MCNYNELCGDCVLNGDLLHGNDTANGKIICKAYVDSLSQEEAIKRFAMLVDKGVLGGKKNG